MRTMSAFAAMMLAACAAQPGQASPEPEQTATLDGRYIVESVDGAPPVINIAGYSPTVTIEGARVHFQSQCIYADWTLHRRGAAVSAKPYFEPGSGMCARGLAPGETAIQEAFSALTMITPTADGWLRVDGGRHRLELRPVG